MYEACEVNEVCKLFFMHHHDTTCTYKNGSSTVHRLQSTSLVSSLLPTRIVFCPFNMTVDAISVLERIDDN